ncbi:hypothetical protein UAY_01817 [Enterococcus moraviensis ATCC BAA-383]|uniref:Uncharacterized protein n=1 Tax=Enterococcus moraviensis ATCC BAA-383 TaxID=1158609 RepID=R2T6N8_9ENTE|nr:hypothetical protein [Enterococcus moraviensis]EOI00714.1 hypothetical protein UAY_01817 [Enterococcus moraviensis ATCC BAA-383]EOT73057.1 hypothetical protein I586_00050 [Enterococcus moraviensis ATCC BAA-383]
MSPTEDKSIMHLNMVQNLINKGARVNNIQLFRGDVVTELTVYLPNFRKLTYSLTLYPTRNQSVKITTASKDILEEKTFDHVYHALKFIESKV